MVASEESAVGLMHFNVPWQFTMPSKELLVLSYQWEECKKKSQIDGLTGQQSNCLIAFKGLPCEICQCAFSSKLHG